MPRQPIIDVHEWISEIPTVPNCCSVKQQGKGTGLQVSAGKEDPVEFDSSLMLCSDMKGVAKVGEGSEPLNSEIPLPSRLLYSLSNLQTAAALQSPSGESLWG